jgi:hypothetical protein
LPDINTKAEKIYHINTKFTNWLLKRLKDGKIFPMAMKSTNIFYFLARKFYENCDFWIENIPSGNPGSKVKFLQ